MEATPYFERTLFYDRSPAANEYYEISADQIFEKDTAKSQIAVHIQSDSDHTEYREKEGEVELTKLEAFEEGKNYGYTGFGAGRKGFKQTEPDAQLGASGVDYLVTCNEIPTSIPSDSSDSDEECSVLSRASSTALPSAMDQRQADSGPPLYPGLPRLALIGIVPGKIEDFVARTKNEFRVFYLRQRHSYSRLQITKEDFETLLESCHAFPRFGEYVIGFGRRYRESEVGPPPLKFRPIYTSQGNTYRGFGRFCSSADVLNAKQTRVCLHPTVYREDRSVSWKKALVTSTVCCLPPIQACPSKSMFNVDTGRCI
ncbi:hypothetical protein N0V94_005488 [Neodidymelliopsis sp. IMI 364377]|nr:hypothetical protein N0V94_005488 [Neodidymelliopsis sp. IMI 364377]